MFIDFIVSGYVHCTYWDLIELLKIFLIRNKIYALSHIIITYNNYNNL